MKRPQVQKQLSALLWIVTDWKHTETPNKSQNVSSVANTHQAVAVVANYASRRAQDRCKLYVRTFVHTSGAPRIEHFSKSTTYAKSAPSK